MGTEYILVNQTKKELISFAHLNGSKKYELVINTGQSEIVTWYLLENQGDQIQFVSDTYGEWPFSIGNRNDLSGYMDKTEDILNKLIEENVLNIKGYLYQDDDEPDDIYILKIEKHG